MLSYFYELRKKYDSLRKKYEYSYNELIKNVSIAEDHKMYSKGGVLLHRGYFSPTALDLGIVGGLKRGRLLKSKSIKNYDFEYIFDINDRLICCKKYSSDEDILELYNTEFLIYEGNYVLSLIFDNFDSKISFISECYYDNIKSKKYLTALFMGDCIEINIEDSEFSDEKISTLLWTRYFSQNDILQQEKYSFNYDNDELVSITAK